MLYKFLHIIFKLSQFVYFKTIKIDENTRNIKKDQANLIIANHPSAFMDPILVGINIKTPIYFLAAEEFMGGKKMSKFLENNFNMIPIYRPSTRPDEIHKNTDSFAKCYQALKEGKSILIFAEGHSETQPWLDPLKSGMARIAIEALEKHSEIEQINIVTLGLNYSNPHQFRSTFLLKIGEIISIHKNHTFNKTSLTDLAQKRLNSAMQGLNKNESDWQTVVVSIFSLMHHHQDLNLSFKAKTQFITQLNAANNKSSFIELKNNTLEFLNQLQKENIKLDGFLLLKHNIKPPFIQLILSFVLTLPGLILNFIPLYLTQLFIAKRDFKYSFKGSMYFTFGTVFMVLWHILTVCITLFFIGWYSLLLPLMMLIFGIIALNPFDFLKQYFKIKRIQNQLVPSQTLNTQHLKLKNSINHLNSIQQI